MHKSLRKVSSELALAHVVFLRKQARRSTCRASPLEPSYRLEPTARDVLTQRHHEAAEEKRAFGVAQWPFVVAKAVEVTVLNQLCVNGRQRGHTPRIVGAYRATDFCHEQRAQREPVVEPAC